MVCYVMLDASGTVVPVQCPRTECKEDTYCTGTCIWYEHKLRQWSESNHTTPSPSLEVAHFLLHSDDSSRNLVLLTKSHRHFILGNLACVY